MTWQDDLTELRTLIRDGYDFWEARADDHHAKSSEGVVSLHFPGRHSPANYDAEPACEIHGYVFGPHRSRNFVTVSEALRAFRGLVERREGGAA